MVSVQPQLLQLRGGRLYGQTRPLQAANATYDLPESHGASHENQSCQREGVPAGPGKNGAPDRDVPGTQLARVLARARHFGRDRRPTEGLGGTR